MHSTCNLNTRAQTVLVLEKQGRMFEMTRVKKVLLIVIVFIVILLWTSGIQLPFLQAKLFFKHVLHRFMEAEFYVERDMNKLRVFSWTRYIYVVECKGTILNCLSLL